jgi:hypothetical protein
MKRLVLIISFFLNAVAMAQSPQWSPGTATEWYSRQPWMVGSNYIQSNTVNQLEMWQQETFDPDRIDLELGWAESLGINTLRVFLHDLVWEHDSGGVQKRMDKLLKLTDKHKMRVIFVLFDSSGDPYPELGHQRQPKPGVRNSLWVQSPGAKGLTDTKQLQKALAYAEEVVAAFSIDKRVLAWDVWNEPDNMNTARFANAEPPNKAELLSTILPQAFRYIRAGNPSQPVTSGLWHGDWSSIEKLSPVEKIQVELSDVISFQNYDGPDEFEKRVKWLKAFGRPVLCTGFLARNQGSTFETILPIAQKYDVAALAGDLVEGKPQMWLPWDSWQHPYTDRQPAVWMQDIFRSKGPAYSEKEADFIRKMIASAAKPVSSKPPKKNGK